LHSQVLIEIGAGLLHVIEFGTDVEHEYGDVLRLCYQRTPPLLLRTLDAIHLASARVANEGEIVAMDSRLRDAAKLLGFTLFPV
jgi:predicted nucleic acid-binding protein